VIYKLLYERSDFMKLREFSFSKLHDNIGWIPGRSSLIIKEEGPCMFEDGKYFEGFIGEVLNAVPIEWADREIKETRWFFTSFVIELKPEQS
jgi:hypothetical protein